MKSNVGGEIRWISKNRVQVRFLDYVKDKSHFETWDLQSHRRISIGASKPLIPAHQGDKIEHHETAGWGVWTNVYGKLNLTVQGIRIQLVVSDRRATVNGHPTNIDTFYPPEVYQAPKHGSIYVYDYEYLSGRREGSVQQIDPVKCALIPLFGEVADSDLSDDGHTIAYTAREFPGPLGDGRQVWVNTLSVGDTKTRKTKQIISGLVRVSGYAIEPRSW